MGSLDCREEIHFVEFLDLDVIFLFKPEPRTSVQY